MFMKNQFNLLSIVSTTETPLLCLVGGNNKKITPEMSVNITNNWKGSKIIKRYENEDNNLLFNDNSSWSDIGQFLKKFEE